MTTAKPTRGHDDANAHSTGEHNAVPTPAAKTIAMVTSTVTPRVAIGWTFAGLATMWLLRTMAAVSIAGLLVVIALVTGAAAVYMAGWVARGRTDGR